MREQGRDLPGRHGGSEIRGQAEHLVRVRRTSVLEELFLVLTRTALLAIASSLLVVFSGCASAPVSRAPGYSQSVADKAADTALTMIGRPYRYRGDTPSGFDCSGLVRYSYLRAGMNLPHGTSALRKMTRSVGLSHARKGDLIFFDQSGKKYSHVGIYVGDDRFVHAPSTGGFVRRDSLDDPYWKKHYLDTRRLL